MCGLNLDEWMEVVPAMTSLIGVQLGHTGGRSAFEGHLEYCFGVMMPV